MDANGRLPATIWRTDRSPDDPESVSGGISFPHMQSIIAFHARKASVESAPDIASWLLPIRLRACRADPVLRTNAIEDGKEMRRKPPWNGRLLFPTTGCRTARREESYPWRFPFTILARVAPRTILVREYRAVTSTYSFCCKSVACTPSHDGVQAVTAKAFSQFASGDTRFFPDLRVAHER